MEAPERQEKVIGRGGHYLVEVHALRVVLGPTRVLDHVDLKVRAGEYVLLVGPNGAGKTTLLRTILGLVSPEEGYVLLRDREPARSGVRIGYVPQRKGASPNFPATPLDVVVAALRRRWPFRVGRHDRILAEAALAATGIAHRATAPMHTLSGGEVQRVYLASAIASDPELLLLDEPMAGVDVEGRAAVARVLGEVAGSGRRTCLHVTHDPEEMGGVATRLVYLDRSVRHDGPPGEVLRRLRAEGRPGADWHGGPGHVDG